MLHPTGVDPPKSEAQESEVRALAQNSRNFHNNNVAYIQGDPKNVLVLSRINNNKYNVSLTMGVLPTTK